MNRNSALALSVVERTCDQIDQGQGYYDGIVNFLNSKENQSILDQSRSDSWPLFKVQNGYFRLSLEYCKPT